MKLWLALCASLAACHIPEANVYNLREVRDPDGSPRRIGAPMTRMEYFARNIVLANMAKDGSLGNKDDEEIDDPDAVALKNLVQLAACDADDPWVRGLQVEMMTWLAVDDGYKLARERAVIELGHLAPRFGVKAPEQMSEGTVAATQDDIVGPLGELVAAVRAYMESGDVPGDDYEAACAQLEALVLDRDGARRLAAATNALLARTKHDNPALASLNKLHVHAAGRAVALALGEALRDEDSVVRAAAVEASLEASDGELAGLRLQALNDSDPIVVVSALQGVAEHGLKTPAALTPEQAAAMRHAFLARFVELSRDLRVPISSAACRALNATADSGFKTYRWEEWNRWWDAQGAAAPPPAEDAAAQ